MNITSGINFISMIIYRTMKTLGIILLSLPFAFSLVWYLYWVVKLTNAKYTVKHKKKK